MSEKELTWAELMEKADLCLRKMDEQEEELRQLNAKADLLLELLRVKR